MQREEPGCDTGPRLLFNPLPSELICGGLRQLLAGHDQSGDGILGGPGLPSGSPHLAV
jgi:hypothetical protein